MSENIYKIARVGLHMWEEPPISGNRGSGAIFFSGCTMKCCYCQNYNISHMGVGLVVDESTLVKLMLSLQDEGANNINLVTPSFYASNLVKALCTAKKLGLNLPIVYNSGGYDGFKNIKKLEGLIDIYLPDFKYFDDQLAIKYSNAPNYFEIAFATIREMRRQRPLDIFEDNIMQKGMNVRHLILPNEIENSKNVLEAIAKIDKKLYVSVMSQYFPTEQVRKHSSLNRRISENEYDEVIDKFYEIGLSNGYMQDLASAIEDYVPDFDINLLKAKINSLK